MNDSRFRRLAATFRAPLAVALLLALGLTALQFLLSHQIDMGILRAKRTLFTVTGTALLLAAPVALLGRRGALALSLVAMVPMALMGWWHVLYSRQFHAALSARMWSQLGNLNGLGPSIFGLARPVDLFYAIIPMMTAAFIWIFFRKNSRSASLRARLATALTLGLTGLSLHGFVHGRNAYVHKRSPFLMSFDSLENLAVFTLPLYHFLDTRDALTSRDRLSLTLEEQQRIQQFAAGSAPVRKISPQPISPNLLLLQWEALEMSVVDLRWNGVEVTPHLNAFLRDSTVFTRFHSVAGHGNTSDAELAALAGLYPLSFASAFFRFGENRYLALPEILRKKGYATLGFHGNAASFWNRGVAWPHMGIAKFFDKRSMQEQEDLPMTGMGIDDNATYSFILRTLFNTPSPWFAFVVTLSSHTPFQLPRALTGLADAPAGMLGDYLRAIHYSDSAFGKFLKGLDELPEASRPLLALYGDHEAIVSDVRNQAKEFPALNSFLSNADRVPFALRFPKDRHPATSGAWGSQVDILPTLAPFLGLESKELPVLAGRDLLGTPQGGAIHPFGKWFGGTDEARAREAIWVSDRIIRSYQGK